MGHFRQLTGRLQPVGEARTIQFIMRRGKAGKKPTKKRGYTANRVVRAPPERVEPERLLRVWRRVLERRMRSRLRAPVAAQIHDNTHTMVTFFRHGKKWHLRLHHMFLAAPEEVLTALARFVSEGDAASSAILDRYIERNKALIRRLPVSVLQKRLRLDPFGDHHNLNRIFERLNSRYFKNRISATITYGPAPRSRGPRKSIKMGSYSAESKVIRIHPALDHPRVPRYFVEWIVFHEMLHHIYRARRREDGKRCVHTPEFVEHERRFHDFKRAQQWENDNLGLLLRARV
jgi:hypothetical protein